MRRLYLRGQTYEIRFLETPAEMDAVEDIQRAVWPGSETDVVPSHLLLTLAHNGGVVLGAYHLESGRMAGFVRTGCWMPHGARAFRCHIS